MKNFILVLFFISFAHAKIDVRSKLPWMKEVGAVTNCVIGLEAFQKEIKAVGSFTFTTHNGDQVAQNLNKAAAVFSTYRSANPLSKATSYTVKNEVYFNLRKNPRTLSSMVNTGVHEAAHVAGYGHGDNDISKDTERKARSVPYLLGDMAEKYVETCKGGL
jgi:hypothetical protein